MDSETGGSAGGHLAALGADRRVWPRFPCGRLVVIRLPGGDGTWRWYWVTDIGVGGLAVSFLVRPDPDASLETTLLDVDGSLSFSVTVRFAWHQESPPMRTGFTFVRTDPGLERWVATFGQERRRRGERPAPALWASPNADTRAG